MLRYKIFHLLPTFETNTYLAWDTETADGFIIDPAAQGKSIIDFIELNHIKIKGIFLTHGHGDHIGGVEAIHSRYNAPIYIHVYDAPMLTDSSLNLSDYMYESVKAPQETMKLVNDMKFKLGTMDWFVIHTPGHTKGSCSYYCENTLFSGDTLFAESIGRTDFPGGNSKQIIESIKKKLFPLPNDTVVLPGHGPSTIIGNEKENNPFLM